jgi:hypothetical protein
VRETAMQHLLHGDSPPLGHPLPRLALCPNLGSSAFASTDMAELATAAAPGVMMLGQGPLSLLQAEWVERVTADLAEHQLELERANDGTM